VTLTGLFLATDLYTAFGLNQKEEIQAAMTCILQVFHKMIFLPLSAMYKLKKYLYRASAELYS
jgi:hypothetical protein